MAGKEAANRDALYKQQTRQLRALRRLLYDPSLDPEKTYSEREGAIILDLTVRQVRAELASGRLAAAAPNASP